MIRKFQFVKLKSSVGKIPIMNAVCPFTNDEITSAKKCMLNKWEKPPDYEKRKQKYEMEMKKNAGGASLEHRESFYSTERDKEEKGSEESKKEIEDPVSKQAENKELDEEEKQETSAIEPKTRAPGGMWIEASDLAHCFQYLLVFYNPRAYASKVNYKDLWLNANDSFIPNEERLYIILKPEDKAEMELAKQAIISEEFKDLPVDIEHEKAKVLFTFAPNGCLFKENELATNYSFCLPNVVNATKSIGFCCSNKVNELSNVKASSH